MRKSPRISRTPYVRALAGSALAATLLVSLTPTAAAETAPVGPPRAEAVSVQESDDSPRLQEDIVGGDPFYIGAARCKIGFSVQGGFVTAGHCGSVGSGVTGSAGGTGTITGSIFPSSDMAHVAELSNWAPTPYIHGDGAPLAIAGSQEAGGGSTVCSPVGPDGWECGVIRAVNVTIDYPQGAVHGLVETSICSEPGDSGAPVVRGDQAQGVIVGGSGIDDCSTYYQPVNPILDQWGLTLLTG